MDRTSAITKLLLILCIIGAVNWGLVGFFNWNLVNAIFGGPAHPGAGVISRIIYALVGLAGLGLLAFLPRLREATPRHTVQRRAEVRP